MNVQDLNAKSLNRSQSRVRSYVIIVLNGMVTCEFILPRIVFLLVIVLYCIL